MKVEGKIEVRGLAIAPKVLADMEECSAVDISVESGISGDARGRKRGRQVTILFEDDWADAISETAGETAGETGGATGGVLSWTERRANILVGGMRAPQAEGGVFTIGDVVLEVAMETDPCDLMESKRAGLRAALTPAWRGGVCCVVKSGGSISVGDEVLYQSAEAGVASE